jgi:MFS family permease
MASFSGILSNYIGRKNSLFLSAICFILGSFICACAPNYHLLLLGRFLAGLGSGIVVVVAPIYLVEVAPPESRGRILNLNQIGIASGSLCAYFFNYWLASSQNWRLMFGLALIPALVQFAGLFSIKETREKGLEASWKDVWERSFSRRLKMILALSFFQALSGSAAIFFFAPRVFESAGFASAESSLLATILVGVVYLAAIILSFWAIDRWGRRFLILSSLSGMALSLLAIAFCFLIHSPWTEWVTLVSVLFYIAFYSVGMGPVPPIVIGEISTCQVRGHVMSLMGAIGWVANYFITLSFLPLVTRLTLGGALFIYALFCIVGLGYFFIKIPETKKKTFEEIERLFKK